MCMRVMITTTTSIGMTYTIRTIFYSFMFFSRINATVVVVAAAAAAAAAVPTSFFICSSIYKRGKDWNSDDTASNENLLKWLLFDFAANKKKIINETQYLTIISFDSGISMNKQSTMKNISHDFIDLDTCNGWEKNAPTSYACSSR